MFFSCNIPNIYLLHNSSVVALCKYIFQLRGKYGEPNGIILVGNTLFYVRNVVSK
jgi:hypothetical protein